MLSLLNSCGVSIARRSNLAILPGFSSVKCEKNMASTSKWTEKLSSVPEVDIDAEGKFKYIQIKVQAPEARPDEIKTIVRGYKWAPFHTDILEHVDEKYKKLGLECNVQGGGRIIHDPDKKNILVYGYSQGFGKANHEITVQLLKKHFPDYEVKWTDEGY